jgi:DNA mismatch endonuclease, patch repair protein
MAEENGIPERRLKVQFKLIILCFCTASLGDFLAFLKMPLYFLCQLRSCLSQLEPEWGGKLVDSIDQAARSAVMARVRGKNTRPELIVRKLVFASGYRYRLHVRTLPGCPDLVFPSRKKVIFVHGCFWHRHDNCGLARIPKSRVEFWSDKLNANKARDVRNIEALRQSGWQVLVVWECELGDRSALGDRLLSFLGPSGARARANAAAGGST